MNLFLSLLKESWALCRLHAAALVPICVVVALCSAASQYVIGVDPTAPIENAGQTGILLVTIIGAGLISIVSYLYALLLFIHPKETPGVLIQEAFARFFPLLGLWIVAFFKMWGWLLLVGLVAAFLPGLKIVASLIGVAGLVCLVLFGPRYLPAKVIWVVEGKGIVEAVDRSYVVTRGYWNTIVGAMAVVGVLCMCIAFAIGVLAGLVQGILLLAAAPAVAITVRELINGFVTGAYQIFIVAFLLVLTQHMLAHPIKKNA